VANGSPVAPFDVTIYMQQQSGWAGYQCAHDGAQDGCFASHRRFYAEFEVLDSLRSGAARAFTYAAGFSASFEWYPARRCLIPHYGVEVGGMVHEHLGHLAQVRPYLGLHLWAGHHWWLNAAFGYCVTPAELYELSGPTFGLLALFNPW
jgi:hypothetical protein